MVLELQLRSDDAYGNSTEDQYDGMDMVILVLVMIVAFPAALCVA